MAEPTPIAASAEGSPNFEETEGTDEVMCISPSTLATAIDQGRVDFARDIRGQLELLRYMRNKRTFVMEAPEVRQEMHLVWKLMIATAIAVTVTVIGAFLTVVAMLDRPLDPDPFVALLLLLSGSVLTATVVAIVRGDDR